MLQQHLDWSEYLQQFNNKKDTILYPGFIFMQGAVVSLQDTWFGAMLCVSLCWMLNVEEEKQWNWLLYLIPLIYLHN